MSNLGAWKSQERIEGEGEGNEGSREKYIAQIKAIKN